MRGLKLLPSQVDEPVGTYLAQIRCALAIEAEQEYALARSWREHGDPEAERRLITSHLRLVAKIAWAYRGYGRLRGLHAPGLLRRRRKDAASPSSV
jgi:DNA-directed RNA polymerase sigma subunit (sigma70/sigma32)